jgi:hypothetical protein
MEEVRNGTEPEKEGEGSVATVVVERYREARNAEFNEAGKERYAHIRDRLEQKETRIAILTGST